MFDYVIIADDYTGAVEIAAKFMNGGYRTAVTLDSGSLGSLRKYSVVAVDTGEGERRAAWLTMARGCAPLVERARELAGAGREVIAAGQSFGGLACVELATHRPDLVTAVIAQSASLWFAGDPVPDPEAEGILLRDLTAGTRTLGVPVVVQAGTDERGLIQGARRLAGIAERTGRLVSAEEFRGGHDLSWWRHGLLSGLSALV